MKKIIYIVFIFTIIVSTLKIFKWNYDNITTKSELIDIKNVIDNSINENENSNKKSNIINITELKEINKDTVGYLEVPNTNVNYPFVKYKDNNYYLKHSFYNKKSNAGWIFMDYRNNINNLNDNTIIYGHNMSNKTMFGSLKDVLNDNWINNEDNHIIKITTEENILQFKIFSIYIIDYTNDYLITSFNDKIQYNEFLQMLKGRSDYSFKTDINNTDKILTLSTCNGKNNKRLVIHAKLINIENI